MGKGRNWIFTINNPTLDLTFSEQVKACWYQKETGATGTVHYQGYLELHNPLSMRTVKNMPGFARSHLEIRRGTREQAIAYATKEETRTEGPFLYGDTFETVQQGKRSDLHLFLDDVKDNMSRNDLFYAHPNVFARFPRFVDEALEKARESRLPALSFTPRAGWQTELHALLSTEPHSRKVYWYVDSTGDTGKSTFSAGLGSSAYVITSGKHADIVYAYNFESTVIFDWPRDAQDRFPYSVAESFKNGYFLSTKYTVKRIRFVVPHVIVFSNYEPDQSKLSADRWEIKYI